MSKIKENYLFVYGTLKRNFGNNVLLQFSEFLGKAITKDKYIMLSSGIPYVIKECNLYKNIEKLNIFGELYKVDMFTLYDCDKLEGHPFFYKREKIKVILLNKNKEIEAWLYFVNNLVFENIPIAPVKEIMFNNKKIRCYCYE